MKKPFHLFFCRTILQKGFYQECRGYYKRMGKKKWLAVYFYGKTEIECHKGLKEAVKKEEKSGFRPDKYSAIKEMSIPKYIPFWKKEN